MTGSTTTACRACWRTAIRCRSAGPHALPAERPARRLERRHRAFLENMLRDALRPTQTVGRSNVAGKLYQASVGRSDNAGQHRGGAGRPRPDQQRAGAVVQLADGGAAGGATCCRGLADRDRPDGTSRVHAGRPTKMAASVVRGANPFNIPEQLSNAMLNWSQGRNVLRWPTSTPTTRPAGAAAAAADEPAQRGGGRPRCQRPDEVRLSLRRAPNCAPQTPAILLQQPGAATAP